MAPSKESQLAAQFKAITGLSSSESTKFIKKYKTVEAAVDAYFAGGNSTAAPSTAAQEKKLGDLWEKYRDPSDPRLIKIDGTMALCNELDIDPGSDAVLFCLAADLGSQSTGEWEKKPFVDGIVAYPGKIDTLAKLKAYLPTLRRQLNTDPAYFKKVYAHAFVMGKSAQPAATRSLALDTSCDFWSLFIPPALHSTPSALSNATTGAAPEFGDAEFDLWIEFVKGKGKDISKDTWALLVDFIRSIDKEFKTYDEEAAWPSMIDDFVEFVRSKRG
ncbi:hypothetical protein IAT38_006101 [Cryptococcus sp. DSM 104549]